MLAHPGPGSRAHKREGGASKGGVGVEGGVLYTGKDKGIVRAIRQRWDVSSVWAGGVLCLHPGTQYAISGWYGRYSGSYSASGQSSMIPPQLCSPRALLAASLSAKDQTTAARKTASQRATSEFHARAKEKEKTAILCCISRPSAVRKCHSQT